VTPKVQPSPRGAAVAHDNFTRKISLISLSELIKAGMRFSKWVHLLADHVPARAVDFEV